jgi:hypothetical protein
MKSFTFTPISAQNAALLGLIQYPGRDACRDFCIVVYPTMVEVAQRRSEFLHNAKNKHYSGH